MRNVYIASVNPMHFSHWNTLKEAQELLNEKVFLCIGQNGLKDCGLFSLKERFEIAHKFYNIPKRQIIILDKKEQVIKVIKNATYIIRGIRSEKDILEIRKLTEYYGVDDCFQKGLPINVPHTMREISSSNLIERIKEGSYKVEDNWVPFELFFLIKEKLQL